MFFQRATLAEKEVTALKEQLNSTNNSVGCEGAKESSMEKPNFEKEISAKDKEVRITIAYIDF